METANELQSTKSVPTRVPKNLVHIASPSSKAQAYTCNSCKSYLASSTDLVSKKFNGSHGKAYLFSKVANVIEGEKKGSCLTSGYHEIADVSCKTCATILGWKYIEASEASQRYKEGKTILERELITAAADDTASTKAAAVSASNEKQGAFPIIQLLSNQFSTGVGLCIVQLDDATKPNHYALLLRDSPSGVQLQTATKPPGQSLSDCAQGLAKDCPLLSQEPFALSIRASNNPANDARVQVIHWFISVQAKASTLPSGLTLFSATEASAKLDDKDKLIASDALVQILAVHEQDKHALSQIIAGRGKNADKVPATSAKSALEPLKPVGNKVELENSVLLEGEGDWNVVETDDEFEEVKA